MAERFNDIGRKLLSPTYDPRSDRPPTADEVLEAAAPGQTKDRKDETATSTSTRVQPKNAELAALEQKSSKQGTTQNVSVFHIRAFYRIQHIF